MDNWKLNRKDKIFEELINEFRPFLRKSKRLDYGSGGTHGTNQFRKAEKELSEHTLRADYKGFEVVIELK